MLECRDGSLYTGWTTDLARRIALHLRGAGSRFVRSRLPLRLRAFWTVADRSEALRSEARFCRLGRARKLAALASGEVFGRPVRNGPHDAGADRAELGDEPPAGHGGHAAPFSNTTRMPTHLAPSAAELETLAAEAASLQARIATSRGEIVFRFHPEVAPRHCASFIKLARAGFYDGLSFHRVEPGFVIQGGCPEGNGRGGPGYRIPAEFSDLPHRAGTVAMARAADPDSAGSQFYICLDDARFLDRQYTVFGDLVSGMEAVGAIRVGDRMETVTIEPATV
ncbi:MAG: peptidylprolyl isomerase [Vulcanimicrobiaceae bacterium]